MIKSWVSWPTLQKELLPHIHKIKGKTLNAGCGTRKIEFPNSTSLTNIDIVDFENIDISCDLENITLEDNSFDSVVNIAVLEHCRKPWKVVKELHRVTKSNGILLCVVPFMQPIHYVPTDYFRFTPDGIISLLEDSGYEIEHWEVTHSFFHFFGWMMEDSLKNKPMIVNLILLPFSLLNKTLTKILPININSAPCVITVVARKK